MIPATQPIPDAVVTGATVASGRDAAAQTRRRTLMRLADRHGEVRVPVRAAPGPGPGADTVDLLDELNTEGRLRYGGLHRTAEGLELVYRRA